MNHTPGPWEPVPFNSEGDINIYTESAGFRVASVLGSDHYRRAHFANARLIAAAPDLLAALVDLRNAAVTSAMTGLAFGSDSPGIEKARAAIRKAEGKPQ